MHQASVQCAGLGSENDFALASMKKIWFVLVLLVVLLAGSAWYLMAPRQDSAADKVAAIAWKETPPNRVVTDPVAVFRRAFWRSPTAADQIVHAERHEWSDAEGVTKWQWFIEVKASPELLKYLREDNAFGLMASKLGKVSSEKPAWFNFKPSDVNVMSSPQANMQLIFKNQGNTLFATDFGLGFRRGAPEQPEVNSAPAAPMPKRLPPTAPPTPGR